MPFSPTISKQRYQRQVVMSHEECYAGNYGNLSQEEAL